MNDGNSVQQNSDLPASGLFFREYQPLVPVFIALIAGILMDRFFLSSSSIETIPGFAFFVWVMLFLLSMIGALFRNVKYNVFCIFLAITAWGGIQHHLYWNFYPKTEIGLRAGSEFHLEFLEGKILRPPQFTQPPEEMFARRGNTEKEPIQTVFQLRVHARRVGKLWERATGLLLVRVLGRVENIHAGDVVQVSGSLIQPSEAMNPGAFSPRMFFRQQRILSILRVPLESNPKVISRPRFWGIWRLVETLRKSASKQLDRFLTDETRPLAASLILGCREEVSAEDLNEMLETGTIHIMAISGLHVGLLAGGFLVFCRLCGIPMRGTVIVVLCAVWLYVLVSGARPPALRAGIIVTISTLGHFMARQQSHINSLAAAGIVVLLLNPTALFSTGTQLSFLAVGTLIFTPFLREREALTRREKAIRADTQSLAWEYLFVPEAPRGLILRQLGWRTWILFLNILYSSLQMTVVLLPLVVRSFHVAAFSGVFMNLLLWLPLMIAMMSGAGVVIAGNIPWFGPFFGCVCSLALNWMITIIHWGASLPFHCLWMQGTPIFWNVILYTLLIGWAVFPGLRFQNRTYYAVVFLALLLLLLPFWNGTSGKTGELRCSAISVSHGLSILIQTPNGKNILFDAGQFAPAEYPARTISEFLWNSGVRRLDALFISHPDMDHYNAIPKILERFQVGQIFVSPQMFTALKKGSITINSEFQADVQEIQTTSMLKNLYQTVKNHKIPMEVISAGNQIPVAENCVFTVLHPSPASLEAEPERTNSNSLVICVEYCGKKILLTGDVAPPGLNYLLELPPILCDVAFAPHHGAKNCCTPEFAKWCKPNHFVICDSFKNEQKHTSELFSELGSTMYHTGRDGAVIFVIRKETEEETSSGSIEVITRKKWNHWL